jgi:DNA segregation ATPase FtsK/SpoIIIE-like protein
MTTQQELITGWAQRISVAASAGALGGKPFQIRQIMTVCGLRAAALEIDAGTQAGQFLRVMSADNCALHRQYVPWRFGTASVYLSGRLVRLDASWEDALAQANIRLSALKRKPNNPNYWVWGVSEAGRTVIGRLDDDVPHYLLSGTTGSGKTEAVRALLAQLSAHNRPGRILNELVLIDGKLGEGLSCLEKLCGVAAPVAVETETARNALGYAVGVMRARYAEYVKTQMRPRGNVIVVMDEVQEFMEDDIIRELTRKIVQLGRAAHVHAILTTQHPTIAGAFGDDGRIRRNVPGRASGRVLDAKSSEVAIGASVPRADWLCGRGDFFVVTPNAFGDNAHRVQIAWIPPEELTAFQTSAPRLDAYPILDQSSIGDFAEMTKSVKWSYTGDELATAIAAAKLEYGGDRLNQLFEANGLERVGAEKRIRLLELARQAVARLEHGLMDSDGNGLPVCLAG